jgi:hypothetical protein
MVIKIIKATAPTPTTTPPTTAPTPTTTPPTTAPTAPTTPEIILI